jgi:hypothetical protein
VAVVAAAVAAVVVAVVVAVAMVTAAAHNSPAFASEFVEVWCQGPSTKSMSLAWPGSDELLRRTLVNDVTVLNLVNGFECMKGGCPSKKRTIRQSAN